MSTPALATLRSYIHVTVGQCWASLRSMAVSSSRAQPRNSRAKRARTSGEAKRNENLVAPAPISSRFLCPSPPLLHSAPNQNRHATQVNAGHAVTSFIGYCKVAQENWVHFASKSIPRVQFDTRLIQSYTQPSKGVFKYRSQITSRCIGLLEVLF